MTYKSKIFSLWQQINWSNQSLMLITRHKLPKVILSGHKWHVTLNTSFLTCHSWNVTLYLSLVFLDSSLMNYPSWIFTLDSPFLILHSQLVTLDLSVSVQSVFVTIVDNLTGPVMIRDNFRKKKPAKIMTSCKKEGGLGKIHNF